VDTAAAKWSPTPCYYGQADEPANRSQPPRDSEPTLQDHSNHRTMAPPAIDTLSISASVSAASDGRLTSVTTAWTDNSRGVNTSSTGKPALSCYGRNITDQRLTSKDGQPIPFVRSHNFDELLGPIDPHRVDCGEEGSFADVWEKLPSLIEYMGYSFGGGGEKEGAGEGGAREPPALPKKVVMRFQNAFVSVEEGKTRQVAPSNFSYQTRDEEDPCNLLLIVTPTGTYAHTDGVGYTTLHSHTKDEAGGVISNWFEAEQTDFAVGHSQVEEPAETKGAATDPSPPSSKRAKVTSLGVAGSGARCGRMLVFSIPLKQKPIATLGAAVGDSFAFEGEEVCVYRSLVATDVDDENVAYRSLGATTVGKARAARLNVGEEAGRAAVSAGRALVFDPTQAVMCTQIDYDVLIGKAGEKLTVSSETAEFVTKDILRQYALCDATCRLSELPACLHKMTDEHKARIAATFTAVKEKTVLDAKKAATEDPFAPQKNALLACM
jgi:hypothetical protein